MLKIEDPEQFRDTIERISVSDLTVEEFIERYERGNRPVIITGVTETWAGTQEWQLKVSERCLVQVCFVTECVWLCRGCGSDSGTRCLRLERVTRGGS